MSQLLKVLFLSTLLSIFACSTRVSVDLFNNSEFPLTVHMGTEKVNIEPRNFMRVSVTDSYFEIHQRSTVWKYSDFFHAPQKILETGYNILDPVYVDNDVVIRAQIDKNGHIFILKRYENFPIQQDTNSQPTRYPLIPKNF